MKRPILQTLSFEAKGIPWRMSSIRRISRCFWSQALHKVRLPRAGPGSVPSPAGGYQIVMTKATGRRRSVHPRRSERSEGRTVAKIGARSDACRPTGVRFPASGCQHWRRASPRSGRGLLS